MPLRTTYFCICGSAVVAVALCDLRLAELQCPHATVAPCVAWLAYAIAQATIRGCWVPPVVREACSIIVIWGCTNYFVVNVVRNTFLCVYHPGHGLVLFVCGANIPAVCGVHTLLCVCEHIAKGVLHGTLTHPSEQLYFVPHVSTMPARVARAESCI